MRDGEMIDRVRDIIGLDAGKLGDQEPITHQLEELCDDTREYMRRIHAQLTNVLQLLECRQVEKLELHRGLSLLESTILYQIMEYDLLKKGQTSLSFALTQTSQRMQQAEGRLSLELLKRSFPDSSTHALSQQSNAVEMQDVWTNTSLIDSSPEVLRQALEDLQSKYSQMEAREEENKVAYDNQSRALKVMEKKDALLREKLENDAIRIRELEEALDETEKEKEAAIAKAVMEVQCLQEENQFLHAEVKLMRNLEKERLEMRRKSEGGSKSPSAVSNGLSTVQKEKATKDTAVSPIEEKATKVVEEIPAIKKPTPAQKKKPTDTEKPPPMKENPIPPRNDASSPPELTDPPSVPMAVNAPQESLPPEKTSTTSITSTTSTTSTTSKTVAVLSLPLQDELARLKKQRSELESVTSQLVAKVRSPQVSTPPANLPAKKQQGSPSFKDLKELLAARRQQNKSNSNSNVNHQTP
jgi:hypothetical protein